MDAVALQPQKEVLQGAPLPLGASIDGDGVNFAVVSQYAEEMFLVLFDQDNALPVETIRMNRTENTWHVHVKGAGAGQLYGYKANGPYDPAHGKRFNPNKLLIDPYAKAVTGKCIDKDHLLYAYDVNAPEKDMAMDGRDNAAIMPKAIVMDDEFDWQGDKSPAIPMDRLIIYEVHVKGFTAHPTSGVKHPGTYAGFIEKIPYLKKLGINAVELMPLHEFYIRNELVEKGLTDYWGYNSIAFFAPELSYSTRRAPGCQVHEFKTLVRELHKAGIEVILDVVYNHTGEGNHLGPTISLKGIDNPSYFKLCQNPDNQGEPYRYYINDSGCGNTVNIESQPAMALILDSLRYWVQVMHVDGFRFDLASILAQVQGQFSHSSVFFEAVSKDPVLSKVKMIAEPWDLTTYQVGHFPAGWSEWNGKYRDTTRKFLKGDEGQAGEMAKRLTGSADLYQDDGRKPYNSINLITCHDGFTLRDVFTYNDKHNDANMENNQDGSNDNHSWNCGIEGETDDPAVRALRKTMVMNALSCLFFSAGTPMLCAGDEVMRTQKGNNNAYCQDNELTWFNWQDISTHKDVFDFCAAAIAFRKDTSLLRRRRFFHGMPSEDIDVPDIMWFDRRLETPQWDNPHLKTLCYQITGQDASGRKHALYLIIHMHHQATVVYLPKLEGVTWHHLVDTSQKSGRSFYPLGMQKSLERQDKIYCRARSVNVLWGM